MWANVEQVGTTEFVGSDSGLGKGAGVAWARDETDDESVL